MNVIKIYKAINGRRRLVDNLSMTYEGNMLTSVCDSASRYSYAGVTDFDGVPSQEYPLTYNDSGSLVSEAWRGIARINYDRMNNPVRIQFSNGSVTRYKYGASGQKFGVESDALTQGQTMYPCTTDYLLGGSLVVKDGMTNKYL